MKELSMRDRTSEHGKGALSSIMWLAVVALVIYMGLNGAPPYIAHWTLTDKMNEVGRMHRGYTDDRILEILMKHVREEELDPYIKPQSFKIETRESNRRITVAYDRQVKWLPIASAQPIVHFTYEAVQPIL
jgi:hypothetical protein